MTNYILRRNKHYLNFVMYFSTVEGATVIVQYVLNASHVAAIQSTRLCHWRPEYKF